MVTRCAGPDLTLGPPAAGRFSLPHMPGLDGIRGLAVLAVLAYHLDLVWAGGGFLGVEVFFTLSGFLITQLLVGELRSRGRVGLVAFARARARRLVP
ncbi:MAG TPA: acyltransferase family protein, partial [Pseudonocardia sp.]